jgi:ElaB/YqjD/DUF883 family membrane-anchored ribosome-binding protein
MPRQNELTPEQKISNAIDTIRTYATESYGKITDSTMEKARAVDDSVKSHPWKSVGIAAAAGAAVGALLTRNNRK